MLSDHKFYVYYNGSHFTGEKKNLFSNACFLRLCNSSVKISQEFHDIFGTNLWAVINVEYSLHLNPFTTVLPKIFTRLLIDSHSSLKVSACQALSHFCCIQSESLPIAFNFLTCVFTRTKQSDTFEINYIIAIYWGLILILFKK